MKFWYLNLNAKPQKCSRFVSTKVVS